MSKIQVPNLTVAVLSFLAVIASLFFAATASKNALVFLVVAVFFALNCAFWIYRLAKASKAL